MAEVGSYAGLKERFIPLRKVRKSSRLRFLSRAEMVTPAIWSAGFLESSVFMKVGEGERRLYLTTPNGYIQPARPGWTWSTLKSLAVYGVAGEVQQAQAAGDVVEACWTRHAHLDHNSSLHLSFKSSQDSLWGTSHDASDGALDQQEDVAMLSPTTTRPSYIRSTSLPSSDPAFSRSFIETENWPKRRVASFELEGALSVPDHPQEYIVKRRRITTSPELERRGVNFTPRWSREPPSPYAAEDAPAARSSQVPSSRARGTTPFAYATPHSHFDSRDSDEDDDLEADHENGANVSQHGDAETGEEWEGVQERDRTNSERSFCDDEGDIVDTDVREDDIEDEANI